MKQQLLGKCIVVDSSEPEEIVNELKKECPVLVRKIYVGDYIVGDIAIERKSTSDFEASIIDGRLFRQVEEMLQSYGKAIIIVEGNERLGRVQTKARVAALARLLTEGISVACTSNKQESAELIIQLYKKLGEEEKPKLVLAKKPRTAKEQRVHVLASIPGVGKKLAEELLETFGSISNIANAPVEDIMKVEKIGEKKAKKIKEVLS